MPRKVMLAPMLMGVLLLASGCAQWRLFPGMECPFARNSGPRIGKPAPELDGEDFEGRRVQLSDQRGKVAVVVFWSTTCPPCRAMIPHERALVERLRDKPFALISVNNDQDHDAAMKMMAAERMTWTHVKTSGAGDPINRRWRVEAWPAVYVIDRKGVVRYTNVRGAELDRAVETLLAES